MPKGGGRKGEIGCKDAREYQELHGRKVINQFNGGRITTDAGGFLLREIEQARGFIQYTIPGGVTIVILK